MQVYLNLLIVSISSIHKRYKYDAASCIHNFNFWQNWCLRQFSWNTRHEWLSGTFCIVSNFNFLAYSQNSSFTHDCIMTKQAYFISLRTPLIDEDVISLRTMNWHANVFGFSFDLKSNKVFPFRYLHFLKIFLNIRKTFFPSSILIFKIILQNCNLRRLWNKTTKHHVFNLWIVIKTLFAV